MATLLKSKPVVMVWGHHTCPAFQGFLSNTSFQHCSYEYEYNLIEKYHKHITFIHMISSEPHPMWPSTNFDSGNIRMNLWSIYK